MKQNQDYTYDLFNFTEIEKITIREIKPPKWNYKWTCPKCGCHMVTYMATVAVREWGYDVICVYCNHVIKTIGEEVPNRGD